LQKKTFYRSFVEIGTFLFRAIHFTTYRFSYIIHSNDHTIKNPNTLGKTVTINKIENVTAENYFSKYSIMVLTGNSLPLFDNFTSVVIYLLILMSLGFVFIEQEMYHINPVLGLLKYKVVKAKCTYEDKPIDLIFIYQTGELQVGKEVSFLNIKNRIIRLKEIKLN
jgi:hypothetical protein